MELTASQETMIPVYNAHPEWGQGYSIRLGVEALLQWEQREGKKLSGILCGVIDQPLLDVQVIHAVCRAFESFQSDRIILQPQYGPHQERGNPVLFGRYWADALCQIPEDQGGRVILRGEGAPYVRHIWVEPDRIWHSGVDIDTEEDYERIVRKGGYDETNRSHP